jgi:type III secretory pathway component EscR
MVTGNPLIMVIMSTYVFKYMVIFSLFENILILNGVPIFLVVLVFLNSSALYLNMYTQRCAHTHMQVHARTHARTHTHENLQHTFSVEDSTS